MRPRPVVHDADTETNNGLLSHFTDTVSLNFNSELILTKFQIKFNSFALLNLYAGSRVGSGDRYFLFYYKIGLFIKFHFYRETLR